MTRNPEAFPKTEYFTIPNPLTYLETLDDFYSSMTEDEEDLSTYLSAMLSMLYVNEMFQGVSCTTCSAFTTIFKTVFENPVSRLIFIGLGRLICIPVTLYMGYHIEVCPGIIK